MKDSVKLTGITSEVKVPAVYIALVLITVLLSAVIWDVYTISFRGGADTVSEVLYSWIREYYPLGVILGVAIGHLILPLTIEVKK